MEQKKIMYDSDEAAQLKTVTGWVSSDGFYYGDDEDLARYTGSTHKVCKCGNEHSKTYMMCNECRKEKELERYYNKEFKKWRGEPLYSYESDEYFFSDDALNWYCEDNNASSDDLLLVICEPQFARIVDDDHWVDDLPEDQYLHDVAPKISKAVEALNKIILEENSVLSWVPGKYRTKVEV